MTTHFDKRRFGMAFDFEHGGVPYHCVTNRFDGGFGELGEIFLDAGKTGSHADIVADEAAILFSIARRFGAPLKEIRSALPKLGNGCPAGPLGTALKLAEGGDA